MTNEKVLLDAKWLWLKMVNESKHIRPIKNHTITQYYKSFGNFQVLSLEEAWQMQKYH